LLKGGIPVTSKQGCNDAPTQPVLPVRYLPQIARRIDLIGQAAQTRFYL